MSLTNLKSTIAAVVTFAALSTSALANHFLDDKHHEPRFYNQHKMSKYHGCGFMGQRMFRGLDLSDTQKKQLKDLLQQQRQTLKTEHLSPKDRAEYYQQMQQLITTPTFDKAKAKQLLDDRQQRHEQRMMSCLETQHKMYQLLTPQQQKTLVERMEHHCKRGRYH